VGVILGTAAYMAPEQARGNVVDKRADIWAFGVALYEMLSGRRAFEGDEASTTLAALVWLPRDGLEPAAHGPDRAGDRDGNASNGQTQAITSGWLSDAPNVATVTTGGLVTGVANGRASIYVIARGRQGQQVVRVVPDYQGRWAGGLL
jgi:serine/threonine protein kinase